MSESRLEDQRGRWFYGAILHVSSRSKRKTHLSLARQRAHTNTRVQTPSHTGVTAAIVTATKRTFPVMADIATMRSLSEDRRRALRYFTSIGSRLSPLCSSCLKGLGYEERERERRGWVTSPSSSATNISVEDSVPHTIAGPIFNFNQRGSLWNVSLFLFLSDVPKRSRFSEKRNNFALYITFHVIF